MMSMLPILMLSLLIPWVIALPLMAINFHTTMDREKLSPFECGFDPPHKSRIPFSLRFFLLAVLFLIFDIEIIIILPIIPLLKTTQFSFYTLPFYTFILLVTLGLLHEWNEGSLYWST